jgi:hypothetical protein
MGIQLPLFGTGTPWIRVKDGHPTGMALYQRHYSCRPYADGRQPLLFAGPGEKEVLLTECGRALFVWRKFISDNTQDGVNCAVFRNEGAGRSSDLILSAMMVAWERWPGERLYTYVNSKKISSTNPGYCFQKAGWSKCGKTKWNKLTILEATPSALCSPMGYGAFTQPLKG